MIRANHRSRLAAAKRDPRARCRPRGTQVEAQIALPRVIPPPARIAAIVAGACLACMLALQFASVAYARDDAAPVAKSISYGADGTLSANGSDLFDFADTVMPGTSPGSAFRIENDSASRCSFSLSVEPASARGDAPAEALGIMKLTVTNLETKQVVYADTLAKASEGAIPLCTLDPKGSCPFALTVDVPDSLDNLYAKASWRSPWTIIAQEVDGAPSQGGTPAKTGASPWAVAVPLAAALSAAILAVAYAKSRRGKDDR